MKCLSKQFLVLLSPARVEFFSTERRYRSVPLNICLFPHIKELILQEEGDFLMLF